MEIKSRKIVVIGAGHVGSHVGFSLVTQGVCDELVYIDIDEKKALAQAEDTADAVVYLPHRVRVKAGDYSDIDDAEIIVISVGPLPNLNETRMDTLGKTITCLEIPHRVRVKAGDYSDIDDAEIIVISVGPLPNLNETRMDTLGKTITCLETVVEGIKNSKFSGIIIDISNPADVITYYLQTKLNYPSNKILSTSVVEGIKNSKFSGIIIDISNPADVITYYLQTKLNYPSNKILSTSTTLDSARLRKVLSKKLNIDQKSIYAYVMGEHGESQMVPWSVATIFGKSLIELMKEEPETYGHLNLEEIANDARYGGWLVLKGKGSTEFGIGTSCVEIIKTILADERKVCMVSTLLRGEYGQSDVYASVPAIVGKNGVEKVIELPMSKEDLEKFGASCDVMRKNYKLALTL